MSGISRRKLLAGSALAALFAQPGLRYARAQTATAWRNWSGALQCQPQGRFSPASESALAEFLASSVGPLRPVGSGHSFAPLVPTEGYLIVLDQLTGLSGVDPQLLQATFAAGTRLSDIGPALETSGQALFNLPDIDRQTLAGATATATHGTGIGFQCLSGYISALRMVTAAGDVLDINGDNEPDLFNAARVSLGALGVVSSITLQNRTPFRLKAENDVQKTEEVLQDFDARAARHRHFEIFPLVHSDYSLTLAIDESDAAINHPQPTTEEDAAFANLMRHWSTLAPGERRPHINAVAEQIQPSKVIDASYKVLSNVRNNRFNEMEYSVPLEAGAECLREVLDTIRKREIDVVFPLEYRYVQRDDTWLGMSSGDEDHASISIHRTASEDYRPYFDLIEPIFWKYGGRPHWGKVHSLDASALRKLYPRFKDFQALRRQLDPTGRLLNQHLRKLFIT